MHQSIGNEVRRLVNGGKGNQARRPPAAARPIAICRIALREDQQPRGDSDRHNRQSPGMAESHVIAEEKHPTAAGKDRLEGGFENGKGAHCVAGGQYLASTKAANESNVRKNATSSAAAKRPML